MTVHGAPPSPTRISISLVDDDAALRRRLQLLLCGSDYDVRAYANAEALLADPRSQTVACLVSDMHMPGVDGFTLLHRLRAGGWMGPAILITSSREEALAVRALSEGFRSVVFKPIAERIILEAVRKAVSLTLDQREDVR
ncbi:MAG: response regulator [Sphingomonas bacterium]|nr:response regulator [Sphingomonas bacterium]